MVEARDKCMGAAAGGLAPRREEEAWRCGVVHEDAGIARVWLGETRGAAGKWVGPI